MSFVLLKKMISETLCEVLKTKLGVSDDMCNDIVDVVEKFLPKLEELVVEPASMEYLVLKKSIETLDPYTTGYSVGVETTLTEIHNKLRCL